MRRARAGAALAVSAAVAAGAGCGKAGAAPEQVSGIAAPAGWEALPQLAAAAKGALGTRVTVDGAEAWGEPAMGCYAVWLAIRADGSAEAVGKQVVAGFAALAAGSGASGGSGAGSGGGEQLVVRDVAAPEGDAGVLALAFERGEHRGRLRARLGGGTIAALACFANQREPAACEPACNALLGAIR